jgi:hypothetical protein
VPQEALGAVLRAALGRCASQPERLRQLMAAFAAAALQHHARRAALDEAHDLEGHFSILEEALAGRCCKPAPPTGGSDVHSGGSSSSSRDQSAAIRHLLQHFQRLSSEQAQPACRAGAGPQPAAAPLPRGLQQGAAARSSSAALPSAAAGAGAGQASGPQQELRALLQQERAQQQLSAARALLACCASPGSLQAALAAAGHRLRAPVLLELLCCCRLAEAATTAPQGWGLPHPLGSWPGAAAAAAAGGGGAPPLMRDEQLVGRPGSWAAQLLRQEVVVRCEAWKRGLQIEQGHGAEEVWGAAQPALVAAACAADAVMLEAVVGSVAALQPVQVQASPSLQLLLRLLKEVEQY